MTLAWMTPVDPTLNARMLEVWPPAHVWQVMKDLPPAADHSQVSVNIQHGLFFRAAGIKTKPVGYSFLFRIAHVSILHHFTTFAWSTISDT